MNLNTELVQTPLQNLFCYIRDLYNARLDCLDFEQEPGNPKIPSENYWHVSQWLDLHRVCAQKHLGDFSLELTSGNEQGSDYLLKVRRIELPLPPVMEEGQEAAHAKALKEYQSKYALQLRVNECYDALHSLYYELRGRAGKRLHLSFGLLHGEIGGKVYRNFLFHVPLRLRLKNHEIRIETDTFAYKIFCEQYFTELLDAHFSRDPGGAVDERKREVLLAVDRFNARTLDYCLHPDFVRTEYFDKGWEMLSVFTRKEAAFFTGAGGLDFTFRPDLPTGQLRFSFSPILQTRVVADQIAVSRDASAIIRNINELHGEGALERVPEFFKKLFAMESSTNKNVATNNISNEWEHATTEDPAPDGRFLFPLPYNQEQFEIALRLREQDAVTVKGPPGTGKSHTIANLISHFVSEGKSILVVSHNAKALSVLRDKLPRGIQDLAVSLVNEGKGNEGLKASVSAIIRHISQRYEASRIESLDEQLSALENKYALLLSDMYRIVQANGERLKLPHPGTGALDDRSAYEWARLFCEIEQRAPVLLKESVPVATDTTDLAEKLHTLTTIANRFQPEDFDLIHYHFLQDHHFPEVQQLRQIEVRLEEITSAIQLDDYARVDPAVADEAFLEDFQRFSELWTALQGTSTALGLLLHPDFERPDLRRLLREYQPLRDQVAAAEKELLSYDMDLSPLEGTDPDILYKQINQLIVRFGEHQHIGWMSRNLMDKALRPFFACRINFNPATELAHFRLIETAINRDRCLKQLNITFPNFLKKYGLAGAGSKGMLRELDLLDTFIEQLGSFNASLRQRGLSAVDPASSAFTQQLTYVGGLSDYAEYKRIRAYLAQAKHRLIDHDQAHPLVFNIARALEFVNRANYELYLAQYREKRQTQPASIRFDQLYKEVGRILPQTALRIKETGQAGEKLFHSIEDIEWDLYYAKVDDFLSQVVSQTRGTAALLSQLQNVKRGIERQTAELVSYKAWFHKAARVSDIQKAALNAWLNDLINIGKGYGKNTARNMASAIRNMQIAKEAVPIWIMPQETAVAFFPDATPGQFDLLIVDEASQCDISSLNLVYRCKKCLIVGDENQTSVVTDRSCFTIERTNELLDKYLISHRFKTQFDVGNKNNSIYTLSGVIYPNIVTLTEHFRCLPEIIGYSSRFIYNGDIVPLKTATERPFGDPLGIEYTEDNPDAEEKPLIVRRVAQAIEEYILRYKEGTIRKLPTIGIITLDSANQAHHHALLREIAGNELIKQHEDQLELLIGSSREFQGDERDVMFLTISAGHSVRKDGDRYTFRPPRAATTEEYMRIYNVATSRAKERSVVFHSIHPDAVALMNPDCYRRKLIEYYQTQASRYRAPAGPSLSPTLPSLLERVDAYGGDFQASVCRYLYEHGWGDYLHPQLEVGKYRIDFGLIRNNRKLAIECDGDVHFTRQEQVREDIARQLILERAHWHFFRIQSTDWFYRRQAVGESLLAWIRENTEVPL